MRSIGWLDGHRCASRVGTVVFAALALVAIAHADDKRSADATPATPTANTSDKQPDPLQERLDYVGRLREAIPRELSLSPEEREQVNTILDEHGEKITAMVNELRERRESNKQAIEIARQEFNEARRHRDATRARELMEQLAALQGRDDSLDKPFLKMESAIKSVLDNDRAVKLQELAFALRAPFRRNVKPASFSIVLLRFKEINPTEEQNEQMRKILREMSPALREAHQAMNRERIDEVEGDFRDRVVALLTDEQKTKYLELEKSAGE